MKVFNIVAKFKELGLFLTKTPFFYSNCNLVRNISVSTFGLYQKWGTKKKHRDIKLNLYFENMGDPAIEAVLAPLRANVKEQVRYLL